MDFLFRIFPDNLVSSDDVTDSDTMNDYSGHAYEDEIRYTLTCEVVKFTCMHVFEIEVHLFLMVYASLKMMKWVGKAERKIKMRVRSGNRGAEMLSKFPTRNFIIIFSTCWLTSDK